MAISKTLHNTLKQYGKISHEFSGELYDNMDNFSFKDVTGYAKNNAKSVGRAATKTARATYEAAKGVYNDLREDGVISDELHGNLKAVKDKAEDFVKTGIEDGKETVEMVGKLAKRQANKVYTTLREVPANLYSGAKEGAQTVYTTARELPSDLYEGVKGRAKQAYRSLREKGIISDEMHEVIKANREKSIAQTKEPKDLEAAKQSIEKPVEQIAQMQVTKDDVALRMQRNQQSQK